MNNKDMPAMPMGKGADGRHWTARDLDCFANNPAANGLTKREQAAIQIMAAIAMDCTNGNEPRYYQGAAESAVNLADALFAELDKRGGE